MSMPGKADPQNYHAQTNPGMLLLRRQTSLTEWYWEAVHSLTTKLEHFLFYLPLENTARLFLISKTSSLSPAPAALADTQTVQKIKTQE